MFAYKDRTDKYGVKYRDYFLTQGDTFTLIGNPPEASKAIIRGVKFRIGTPDPNDENNIVEMYSQDYVKGDDDKYYCAVNSDITKNWKITGDDEPYVYEVAVSLSDGNEKTVMQADFTVWKQIKEG